MKQQFAGLQRRTTGAGRDSVDHGVGAHDDLANSCAGALCRVLEEGSKGTLGLVVYFKEMFSGKRKIPRSFEEAKSSKPTETRVEGFLEWQRTGRAPACKACGNSSTVYNELRQVRCNQCGAIDGVPLVTVADGWCPKCGLAMRNISGSWYCQNDGHVPVSASVQHGTTFAVLNRSRGGFRQFGRFG